MAKDLEKAVVYSALEVANICGVANQTTINWIRNGYLKAFSTPGGQYRVYTEDLLAFMAERKMRIPDFLQNTSVSVSVPNCVLVVEDEIGLNTVIKQYLEKTFPHITVYQAFDGFEAGALVSTHKPSLIILDLNLPGVDGFELCKKINTDESFGFPSVIIITGLQDSVLDKKMERLNISGFFRKPIVLKELAEVVDIYLKKSLTATE